MSDFNKKKAYRKVIYSPFTLLLLLILLLLLLKALWGVSMKERLSAKYLSGEQAELQRVTAREKELSRSVEYLKTDRGVESEIRSKFRVVKDGESVAVILGNEKKEETATSTPEIHSLWSRFIGFFGF